MESSKMDLLHILSFRLTKTEFKDAINILQTGPMFWLSRMNAHWLPEECQINSRMIWMYNGCFLTEILLPTEWGDPQNSGPCLLLWAKECLTQCGKEAQGIMWKVLDFLFLSLWVYTSGISENYNYPELTLTIQISLNSPNNWWNITFFLSPSPPWM